MAESKHSPGPWTLVRHGKGHGYDVVGGGPEPETVVYDVRNTRHEQAVANARLIAAAPELLEALKRLGDLYDGECREEIRGDGFRIHVLRHGHLVNAETCPACQARAAIAKATGEGRS